MTELQMSTISEANVTVEDVDIISYDETKTASILAMKVVCTGFGDLPATLQMPKNALEMVECSVSYSNMGDRHRCHRGATCILTDKHMPDKECARQDKRTNRGGRQGKSAGVRKAAEKKTAGEAQPQLPAARRPAAIPFNLPQAIANTAAAKKQRVQGSASEEAMAVTP